MSRTIEVGDEVFAEMQRQAVPLLDTPDSLLRRLLGMSPEPGTDLRLNDYYTPTGELRFKRPPVSEAKQTRTPRGQTKAKAKTKPKRERATRGSIAPESIYVEPILRILSEKEGRAPKRELLDELGVRISDQLLPADHEMMGNEERWRKRAQFVRLALIKQGLMKADSPRGVWEITDEGRKRIGA